jgi:hypothetical protein
MKFAALFLVFCIVYQVQSLSLGNMFNKLINTSPKQAVDATGRGSITKGF